jgi:acetolactate synthase regulatory subunit
MKKIIAFAVLAFALAAGTTAVTMTVHPQRAVALLEPQLPNL